MDQKNLTTVSSELETKARLAELKKEDAAEKKAREDERKNKDFIQFSRKAITPFRHLIKRDPKAAQVLLAMIDIMGHTNSLVCSAGTMEEITGVSKATFFRKLELLKKEKWIEEMEGCPPKTFRVNSTVFWATYSVYKDASFQEPLQIPKDELTKKSNAIAVLKGVPILVLREKRKKS
jgi:hypothetical protein